jgi:chromosome segregation ATPase
MTDFTSEFIAKLRMFNKNILDNELSIQHPFLNMHASAFLSALDHIERLQSRVQEVEDNREYIEMLLCKAEKHIAELEETISQDTKVNVAHIALLNSDIAELEQERRWISVEEKPKYNDDYLVLTMDEYGDSYQEVAQYIDGSFFDEYDNKIKPTYWQPLPKPPQESDE